MAGLKLSAKAQEEVEFMDHLLKQTDHLQAETEKYAGMKKNADSAIMGIIRTLGTIRQHAMMKNLGPVADSAGSLGIMASRGSQMQRTRVLRDGLAAFRQLIERTQKATIGADVRSRKEAHDKLGAH